MWLTPNSRSTGSTSSARSWFMRERAAAPKITRELSWPVRPKGARAIITFDAIPAVHGRRPRASGCLTRSAPGRTASGRTVLLQLDRVARRVHDPDLDRPLSLDASHVVDAPRLQLGDGAGEV